MDGMLSEHGPLLVDESGDSLIENPYAWNLFANMIYLGIPNACPITRATLHSVSSLLFLRSSIFNFSKWKNDF